MAARSAFVPVVVAEHLTWDDVVRVVGQRAGAARRDPRGRPQPLLPRRLQHRARASATSARSPRATSPSSRTPTRCCKSRASRSARPASRRGSSRCCAAQAGNLKIEVSAAGRVMRELGRVEGTAGKDLQLTLDLGAAGLRHAAHGRRRAPPPR